MKPKLWHGRRSFRTSFSQPLRWRKLKLSQLGMPGSNQSVEHVPHCRSQPDGAACFIHKTKNLKILNFMSRKVFLRLSLSAVALGAVTILYTGFGRSTAQHQTLPPPSVTVSPVEQKEIVEWDEFTGRTEPVESVEVRPR